MFTTHPYLQWSFQPSVHLSITVWYLRHLDPKSASVYWESTNARYYFATVVYAKKQKILLFLKLFPFWLEYIVYVKQELCNRNNYVIENIVIKAETVHEQFCKTSGEENLCFRVSRMKQQGWVYVDGFMREIVLPHLDTERDHHCLGKEDKYASSKLEKRTQFSILLILTLSYFGL